jgi:multidrug resistance efflux pump
MDYISSASDLGESVVNQQLAEARQRIAQLEQELAASHVAARVVLTGISAELARTFTVLGTEFTGIVTRSTLQSGIAFAVGQAA